MKLRKLALAPIAAAAAIAFGTPAIANSLLFQGVTFETLAVDSDTLQLSILNATSATGDWTGVGFLKAFEIKDIGAVSGATVVSAPAGTSWTPNVENGLAGNTLGCGTGGTGGACFYTTPPATLTDSMSWTIDFAGTNLSFDAPHLKLQFMTNVNDTSKTGNLLSQAIPGVPAIPEPETYAMMLAGLSLLGFVARRRKQVLGNLVPA
jgi:hypothetical protein